MANDYLASLIRRLRAVRLEESKLIDRIEAISPPHEVTSQALSHTFRVGDEVYIQNNVSKPKTWSNRSPEWCPFLERQAVITGIRGDRVYIHTSNGRKTWRAAKHLLFVGPA
jgi:hypothetical protein